MTHDPKTTFYVLDLGIDDPETFADEAKLVTAASAPRAAEDWVSTHWYDYHDGMSGDLLVADNPAGERARRFTVRCRVEVSFTAKEVSRG